MASFDDLTFTSHPNHGAGTQATMFFPNGYGASVIQSPYSYGGAEGLYELAVFAGTEADHELTYDTPVTDDVEGWLTPERVADLLTQIEALPVRAPTEAAQ